MNNHFATYSRSDDCFPAIAPRVFQSASGCHVTADDGREFIDFGMALRSVILGYCYPAVDEKVIEAIRKGISFTRSNPYEGELREIITQELKLGEECKLGKNGSDATHAACKLARAATCKDIVLIAEENPFISTADFFIGSTPVNDGIPWEEQTNTVKFSYNDMTAGNFVSCPMHIEKFIDQHEYEIAAIFLDPATVDITKEKLQYIRDLCNKYRIVMILDETISGFRYDLRGVQGLYGIKPDLACYGKGIANGYALSCLTGRKEIMDLGLRDKGNVFLLSGTYFSNTADIAAAIATIRELQNKKVNEYINLRGFYFVNSMEDIIKSRKMEEHIKFTPASRPCNPQLSFSSMELKTLFDQCMIQEGILAPYWAISFSHTHEDINRTIEAAEMALATCRKAIDNECVKESLLGGHCEAPVFRRT